jgi:ligand-binding SRPBCC domain-containing protein
MFKKKHTFSFSSVLQTTPEKLFDFHSDTNNLPAITPPWIKVSIVDLTLPLQEKSEISLDIKQFGVTMRWVMQIAELKSPNRVCDQALKSPFKSFYHEHVFTAINDTETKLEDIITFELPLYPLSWVALPFVKRDMKKMFAYRHEKSKEILEDG